MTIFLCEPGYTGILSGIYDAGVSKIPQDELRLEIKNSGQNVELFAVYRECSPSEEKGKKVLETVRQPIFRSSYMWPVSARMFCGRIKCTGI